MQVASCFGRARALPALIIVAVVAAGCGSSSTSKTKTKTTAVAQTSPSSSSSSSSATSTTAASSAPSSSSSSTSSSSPSSSSTSASAGGSHRLTKAQAGKAYLALANPVQKAGNAFGASVNDSDTGQQVAAKAKPLLAVYKTGDAKLLALARRYPPAAADLKSMVKVNLAVVIDLRDVGQVTAATEAQWSQQFAHDAKRASTRISKVRSDLGLRQRSG